MHIERNGRGPPRDELQKQRVRPLRQQQSDRAADAGEQHALRQQLPKQPPGSGAERNSHSNLLLARSRPGQQKIRHVGAGDQQHQSDDRHQNHERLAESLVQIRSAVAAVREGDMLVQEILLFTARNPGSDLRLEILLKRQLGIGFRLRQRDSGLSPGQHLQPLRFLDGILLRRKKVFARENFGLHGQRHPDVRRKTDRDAAKLRRRNTDYVVRSAANANLASRTGFAPPKRPCQNA